MLMLILCKKILMSNYSLCGILNFVFNHSKSLNFFLTKTKKLKIKRSYA